jgi:hypothetical protein
MKCPHCCVEIYVEPERADLIETYNKKWAAEYYRCPNPACGGIVINLLEIWISQTPGLMGGRKTFPAYPRITGRSPVPPEVPEEITEAFEEACLVLSDSPKASAALSRRCLQNLLREAAGATQKDLAKQIDYVLAHGDLGSRLKKNLDAVREVGNFAAHPIKSENTGQIVPVEPAEAEWNLDVLERLFDYYYVQPLVDEQMRSQTNVKLREAGKPELL